jgi:hypothetical protein
MKSIALSSRLVLVLLIIVVAFVGCSKKEGTSPTSTTGGEPENILSALNPQVQAAMVIQDEFTPQLMNDPNIVGTATSVTADGKPAVLLMLKTDRGVNALPRNLKGVPVVYEVTGEFKALAATAVSHKTRQTRPIQLGVSGGNALDLANGYCCSGTLGALVTKNGNQYILSNSHVFAHDIVASSGDPDKAQIGDPIDQPGLIDVSCANKPADYVANLSTLSSISPPTGVDCSIAQVIAGQVATNGSILEVGTISKTPISPAVNMKVKKSGRTTGLTRSTISGINGTVTVGYDNECNGTAFNVKFTGQIIIKNTGSRFLAGGDSGSLMVQDVTTNPRPVGLLFAGSSTTAVANPITAVLNYLGVTMVGI